MKEVFYGHNKYTGMFDLLTGKGRAFRRQFRNISFLGMKELIDDDFEGQFNWALYFKGVNDELLCISVSTDAFNQSNLITLRAGENYTICSYINGKIFEIRITKGA